MEKQVKDEALVVEDMEDDVYKVERFIEKRLIKLHLR